MLLDAITAALPELRRHAESLMVDTCEVKRPTGTTLDTDTGAEVPTYDDGFTFTSPCKVQTSGLTARDAEAGGREATTVRLEIHLPIAAVGLVKDDEVTITASVHDSQLVGRTFRVTAPDAKSYATARRVEVEEVVS